METEDLSQIINDWAETQWSPRSNVDFSVVGPITIAGGPSTIDQAENDETPF